MQVIDSIFYIVILIMSIVVHEVFHGYVAYKLGDDTARLQGRLTLNPIKHLDLFGSVVLPLILVISKAGFVLGWAKPVPYNPNNLRNRKHGIVMVALAGICANILLAIVFGLSIRFGTVFGLPPYDALLVHPFYKITTAIVLVNLVLAFFNLIPIPPLDGSKVLFGLLPDRFHSFYSILEKWGMFILLFFIIFLWGYVSPIVFFVFSFLTGLH